MTSSSVRQQRRRQQMSLVACLVGLLIHAVGGASQQLTCSSIIGHIKKSQSLSSERDSELPENVGAAARDFSDATASSSNDGSDGGGGGGHGAWRFLHGLATCPAFAREFWHKKPLLIRAEDTGGWVEGTFTVERDLRLIGGSYINGHRTADILRNGTKTDTWEFKSLKDNPARQTTWEEVEEALKGGTIYFNTAGSLWPNLGALCRLTGYAFGIPTNVNVYVTRPGVSTSVPPHTDRQDVLVFQTAGAKRWRVYAPPARKKGSDPLNRGKGGDVLAFEDMGEPLVDVVLEKGDVLYVPTGFPHTTDTCTVIDAKDGDGPESEEDASSDVFGETSVHLTMGLDTNVWMLTYAHLRWSLLQRSGKNYNIDIKDDAAYWGAMESIPVGFLGGHGWEVVYNQMKEGGPMDETFKERVVNEVKRVMIDLEPNRWKSSGANDKGREELPSDEEFGDVVEYMFKDHMLPLMELQEEMFTNIDPHRDDTIIKAYQCTQKQNSIMERFGKFSKNEAMEQSFARSRAERDMLAAKANNANANEM